MIDLNVDQQEVVQDPDGARSVIAGPGSGKTATMVRLIDDLLNSGIPASDIRAVTFSNEMAKALEARVKVKGIVSTFHSLGYLICSEVSRKPVEHEIRYRLMCRLCNKWNIEYKELDGFIGDVVRCHRHGFTLFSQRSVKPMPFMRFCCISANPQAHGE